MEDITENIEIESQLRFQRAELARISRLSTMGEMASRLTHGLSQPLNAIAYNCDAGITVLDEK